MKRKALLSISQQTRKYLNTYNIFVLLFQYLLQIHLVSLKLESGILLTRKQRLFLCSHPKSGAVISDKVLIRGKNTFDIFFQKSFLFFVFFSGSIRIWNILFCDIPRKMESHTSKLNETCYKKQQTLYIITFLENTSSTEKSSVLIFILQAAGL